MPPPQPLRQRMAPAAGPRRRRQHWGAIVIVVGVAVPPAVGPHRRVRAVVLADAARWHDGCIAGSLGAGGAAEPGASAMIDCSNEEPKNRSCRLWT
jgi:hypothetical protein